MKDFNFDNEPKIKTGFVVPKDYFETLEAKILLATTDEKETKVIRPQFQTKKWIMAIAAVLVIGFGLNYLWDNTTNETEIDTASLENYLSYQPDVTQYQLLQLLDEEDIQNLEVDLNLEQDDLEYYLESKNIEKYLID